MPTSRRDCKNRGNVTTREVVYCYLNVEHVSSCSVGYGATFGYDMLSGLWCYLWSRHAQWVVVLPLVSTWSVGYGVTFGHEVFDGYLVDGEFAEGEVAGGVQVGRGVFRKRDVVALVPKITIMLFKCNRTDENETW